jgi:TonB family protein
MKPIIAATFTIIGLFCVSTAIGQNKNAEPLMGWSGFKEKCATLPEVNHLLDSLGFVLIDFQFDISKKGKLNALKVNDSTIQSELVIPIIKDSLKKVLWSPGLKKGKKVASTFRFSLWFEKRSSYLTKMALEYSLLKKLADSIRKADTIEIRDKTYMLKTNSDYQLSRFPGAEISFLQLFTDNFVYPARCQEDGISGFVTLNFDVSATGDILNIHVAEQSEPCPEFANESVKVLKESGKWIPALYKGHYIYSTRSLPIRLNVE